MNPAFKHLISIIRQHSAFVICFQDGEEKHVLDVGRGHHSPTLAHRAGRLYPDLLLYFHADDGFGLVGVGRVAGKGHIGVQPVSQEFFDDRDRTVIGFGDVPQLGESLGVTVPNIPRTWERQLAILVNDLVIFNDQGNGPKVHFIIEGYDVVLWLARLVLILLSLAGNVSHLVCRQGRSLGESSSIHQVSDVVGLI